MCAHRASTIVRRIVHRPAEAILSSARVFRLSIKPYRHSGGHRRSINQSSSFVLGVINKRYRNPARSGSRPRPQLQQRKAHRSRSIVHRESVSSGAGSGTAGRAAISRGFPGLHSTAAPDGLSLRGVVGPCRRCLVSPIFVRSFVRCISIPDKSVTNG